MIDWDMGHPYAFRTWLRVRLPRFPITLDIARKGEDCKGDGGTISMVN